MTCKTENLHRQTCKTQHFTFSLCSLCYFYYFTCFLYSYVGINLWLMLCICLCFTSLLCERYFVNDRLTSAECLSNLWMEAQYITSNDVFQLCFLSSDIAMYPLWLQLCYAEGLNAEMEVGFCYFKLVLSLFLFLSCEDFWWSLWGTSKQKVSSMMSCLSMYNFSLNMPDLI